MKKSAFSLIELAVVITIIGILVVGVTQGAGLINSARLANARSLTVKSPVPQISGLIAWYETSLKESLNPSETDDAAQVTSWFDISPDSIADIRNTMTKAASSNAVYRTSGINRVPSIQFNGAGKFALATFYQGSSAQATIFLVLKPEFAPSATQVIPFDADVAQSRFSVGIKSTAVRLDAGTGADTAASPNPASFQTGGNYIIAAYFNSTASAAYVNNAITSAGSANINAGTNSLSGLSIGTDKTTSSGFTGMISEVIIYNRPLKLQERKDVMSYLSKKYKISVTGI
jgi:prepilin-type N-terminal cleavage/methylation domain-containing protein